ncbi:unnamed protein product, partial [Porites evermanni]
MGNECQRFLKHLADKIAQKDTEPYHVVITWLRTQISFELLRSGTLDETSSEAYGWLVFIAVISIITCPFTAVMNALVILAVKTIHRLKTKTNMALACLSTTDLVMEVIGQPAFIFWVIAQMQGSTSATYCIRTLLSTILLRMLGFASLSHLAMINVERFIAIKHPLSYETIVTKNRLVCLSALLWMLVISLTVPFPFVDNKEIFLIADIHVISLCLTTVFFCQVVLFYETRRHEKRIATQQVSLEAREKFLKEKKAFKVTATVLFFLILCFLPLMFAYLIRASNSITTSVDLKYVALSTGLTSAVLNSMVNPIIYCVRIRQFRVAFIQLIFQKSSAGAENMEKRIKRGSIHAITCPLTIVMNALIIIAVKTKPRVKTKSNIALACLSTTDLAMGVIGQPLFISGVIAELQG